jgi:predicted amidohydrolase YtcJ
VRQVLDGYEAVRKENGARDSRHRIEHLELVHPQDIDRVHSLGVIASMQPSHPPGSMDFPEEPWRSRVGPDRWVNAFPARALRGVGAPIPFASDWPVADLNPMRNIQAALTRKGFSPSCPDNRCSLMEALESYTSAGAYTGFEENIRGQLAPGYQADVVVLDADLETLEAEQIGDVAVVLTLQGGVETWKA